MTARSRSRSRDGQRRLQQSRCSDFTDQHAPLSDLFEQPSTVEGWAKYALSEAQIAQFNRDGYLTGVRILSNEQVEVLCAELEALYDRNHPRADLWYQFDCILPTDNPRDKLFNSLGAWRMSAGFHDICWSPAFRMAAFQLLGSQYRLLHDQLFCKPAKDGGVVSWHQDYAYWTWTKPLAHLTCWVGLDDVSTESGGLCYVPGSHTWGLLPTTGLAADMEWVKQVLDPSQVEQLQNCKAPAELPKGYASFHHPLTMHGSYGNISSNVRRGTAIHVMRDGVVSNIGKRDMGKFPAPPSGTVMQGPCYPMLIANDAELGLMSKAAGKACNPALPLDLAEYDAMMLQALRQRLQVERQRSTS
ncbi:unnamed protein product [Polarella glacialis]|uniref:Phytanoyl-CoA dioxygenase family protein n=1 Tax=Polarella glacialis TaxID=89957 RepID=A0A813G4M1_POLGL|nr:unnamed protein product [Polarella glacialis]